MQLNSRFDWTWEWLLRQMLHKSQKKPTCSCYQMTKEGTPRDVDRLTETEVDIQGGLSENWSISHWPGSHHSGLHINQRCRTRDLKISHQPKMDDSRTRHLYMNTRGWRQSAFWACIISPVMPYKDVQNSVDPRNYSLALCLCSTIAIRCHWLIIGRWKISRWWRARTRLTALIPFEQ